MLNNEDTFLRFEQDIRQIDIGRTKMSSENYVYKKEVDWSLLNYGLSISLYPNGAEQKIVINLHLVYCQRVGQKREKAVQNSGREQFQ